MTDATWHRACTQRAKRDYRETKNTEARVRQTTRRTCATSRFDRANNLGDAAMGAADRDLLSGFGLHVRCFQTADQIWRWERVNRDGTVVASLHSFSTYEDCRADALRSAAALN